MDSNMIFFKKRVFLFLFVYLVGMQSMHINSAETMMPSFPRQVIERVSNLKSEGISAFISQVWKKYRFPAGIGLFVLALLYNGYVQAVSSKESEIRQRLNVPFTYSTTNGDYHVAFEDINRIINDIPARLVWPDRGVYKKLLKTPEAFIEEQENPKGLPFVKATAQTISKYKQDIKLNPQFTPEEAICAFAQSRQGYNKGQQIPTEATDFWLTVILDFDGKVLEKLKLYEEISPTFHGDSGLKDAIRVIEECKKPAAEIKQIDKK
jgi:hypothetical protein